MTQDQINTATLPELEARAAELAETIADPNTDATLYLGAKNELAAVNTQAANLYYAPFFA